jgi:hypothetical protein
VKQHIKALIQLYKKYRDPDTIFIYQMGKVGSTTLEHALPNSVHIHNFYSKNHPCQTRLKGLAGFGWRYYIKRLQQESELAVMRLAFRMRKHTKIITLVREPLGRNVSMFFHDLDCYLFALYTNCDRTAFPPVATRSQDPAVLQEAFEKHYVHNYPLTWFDDELKRMTGVDIYAQPFDHQTRVAQFHNGRFSILCLDIAVLSQSEKQLSEFLGKAVRLERANDAQKKWYAALYQQFKHDYRPSAELVKRMKNNKYYQHFFARGD